MCDSHPFMLTSSSYNTMGRFPPNEHFIHWKYHQKYDGCEETTCVPQLRHNVSDRKVNLRSTFMTNTKYVYEISERNSQICVFWCVIVTHLCWRHLNMVQWLEFHPMNISSIGKTTKSMMDLKKPPACRICDTMCRTQNCILKSILEGH